MCSSDLVGQHRHRAHLPLVDQGEQNAGGVVEQWLSAQVSCGTPSSAATLLGVALVGAGGLGPGQLGANRASSVLVMPVSRGSASRVSMA